jgi:hypothetical protein
MHSSMAVKAHTSAVTTVTEVSNINRTGLDRLVSCR